MVEKARSGTRPRLSSEESRAMIIKAADSLLRNGPYRDLSVELVMNEAGLSRTIFYRHFDDMPGLVTELLRGLGADVDRATRELVQLENESVSAATVRSAMAIWVDFFQRHGTLLRGVAEGAGVDEEIELAYDRVRRHFSVVVAEGLRRLSEAGRLDGMDPDSVAEALNVMNERYLLRTLGREPQEDPQAVVETLSLIWIRTLQLG
jgi:AcrR family transcriptional regulator